MSPIPSNTSKSPGTNQTRTLLLALLPPGLLFTLVFALFAPSIRHSLVDLDDFSYITQNRIVLQGLSPANFRAVFSFSNMTATMYMPLLWLSYMADVSLFGASTGHPAPFHATNVVLHAFSALLLYCILRRLYRLAHPGTPPESAASLLAPFFLALLWAIHPLRVESVAWVAERKDVLSAVFGLAATHCWLLAVSPLSPSTPDTSASPRPAPLFFRSVFLLSAVVLYVLGLLAKPSLVPLPVAWLALDCWPLRRIPSVWTSGFFPAVLRVAAEKLIFLPFAVASAWLAVAQHHAVSGALYVPWPTRIAAVGPNLLFYVRKTLWPADLSPLVPEQWHFPATTVLLSLFVCAALATALWSFRRRLPSLLPGTVWMLLFFLPASGLQPLPLNTLADRFFHLPAIGLSIALLSLPDALSGFRRFRHRLIPVLVSASLLAALAIATARLLPVWASTRDLYTHVNRIYPNQPFAVYGLATGIIKTTGDFQAAESLVAPALVQHPDAWILRCIHADCLLQLDSPQAAIDFLSRSHEPEDRYTAAALFFCLANYEFFAGDHSAALRHVEQALPFYAADSTARTPALLLALGSAFESGDHPKALSFARRTRIYADADSVSPENLLPLAIFHWVYSYRAQATALFFRILDDCPGRTDLWNNLLWGLATADWSPADPAEVLARTLRMQADSATPDHPGILDTVAAAQANAGDFESALSTLGKVLAQIPDPANPFRRRVLARQSLYLSRVPYRENAFERLFYTTFGTPADTL